MPIIYGEIVPQRLTGNYTVKPMDSQDNYNAVVLTGKDIEFQLDLNSENENLKNRLSELERRHKRSIEKIESLSREIENLQNGSVQKELGAYKNAYSELKASHENLENNFQEKEKKIAQLNNSTQAMLRIMRERENAHRGLVPKTKHSGYVILSMTQIINAWRVKFQTPYPIQMTYRAVREQFELDFLNGMCDEINCYFSNQVSQEKKKTTNIIQRLFFNADFNTGLWEVWIQSDWSINLSDSVLSNYYKPKKKTDETVQTEPKRDDEETHS